MKINIAIADDHHRLRKGLADWLTARNYNILFQVPNGKELLDRMKISRPFPHICIIDYRMPVLNGLETLKTIKSSWPFIRVIVMTMNSDISIKEQALELGAEGFFLKGNDVNELVGMIESFDVIS